MPGSLPTGPDTCPSWCHSHQCGEYADHVCHASAPVDWPAGNDDAQLSLARYRIDSHGQPGPEGWLLTVRHDGVNEQSWTMLDDHALDMFSAARMQLRSAVHPSVPPVPQMWLTEHGIAVNDPGA